MEDGTKEEPAQPKETRFPGKGGWVKKATSRLLASYKDRYICVEKTEIVVYENEERKTCLERLDLENYDKCHELRSAFKKKNRLVLIRAAKSGNKVHDVKFQARTPEEKDAWIKALSDGISRAKNKVFDEVKVDESNNLEHVTRTRPKGNRNRRPPTRIHMKEVARVSSDGHLRLDLDLLDQDLAMFNGNHYTDVDTSERPKETTGLSSPSAAEEEQLGLSDEEEAQAKETSPQKKVLKPPMPPSKEEEPGSAEDEAPKEDAPEKKVLKPPMPPSKEEKPGSPEDEAPDAPEKKVLKPPMPPSKEEKPGSAEDEAPDAPEKKVLKPPMPPSKGTKPSASPVEEPAKENPTENTSEKSPNVSKKTGPPPPTPPNKPTTRNSTDADAPQSRPNSQPPTPPSKHRKPSPSQEVAPLNSDGATDENNEKEGGDEEKTETPETGSKDPDVKEDPAMADPTESSGAEGHPKSSEPEEPEEASSSSGAENAPNNEPRTSSQLTPVTPPVSLKKSPGPLTPKKKPVKLCPPKAAAPSEPQIKPAEEETPTSSPHAEEEAPKLPLESKNDLPAVVLPPNDPVIDSPSPPLCRLHAETKERAEEKSVDSGQHSDDGSEGSDSGDILAASTAALRGSNAGLDVLDVSEDDIESPDSLGRITDDEPPATMQVQVSPKMRSTRAPPIVPFKLKTKAKSASFADLLSESSDRAQTRQPTGGTAPGDGVTTPSSDLTNLESEVAAELEKTAELLSSVSKSPGGGARDGMPGDLLAEAMEKLKRADHFLREVKQLKESKLRENASKRHSW